MTEQQKKMTESRGDGRSWARSVRSGPRRLGRTARARTDARKKASVVGWTVALVGPGDV
jgi:hypothetical protein